MTDQIDFEVCVVPASSTQRDVIANLMQMYLHEVRGGNGKGVSESGAFEYPFLDLYWVESSRYPFLINANGAVAGFALVRELGQSVHEIAEFYILHRFRSHGIGTTAAIKLFQQFEGTWRVAQEARNVQAQRFWRQCIQEFTCGDFQEKWSDQGPCGPVQTFDYHNYSST